IKGLEVRVYSGNRLIESPEKFILHTLFFNKKGKPVLYIHRALLEELGRNPEFISKLVYRVHLSAKLKKDNAALNIALRKSEGQEDFQLFLKPIAASRIVSAKEIKEEVKRKELDLSKDAAIEQLSASVSDARLKQHLAVPGGNIGSKGHKKAAKYIEEYFKNINVPVKRYYFDSEYGITNNIEATLKGKSDK
ncbi:unnamed protein product, partial [marine sediment metagenome]